MGVEHGPAAMIDHTQPEAVITALGLGMKLMKHKSDGNEQERWVELDSDGGKLLIESGRSILGGKAGFRESRSPP